MSQAVVILRIENPDDHPASELRDLLGWVINVGENEAESVADDGGDEPVNREKAAEINALTIKIESIFTPRDYWFVFETHVIGETPSIQQLRFETQREMDMFIRGIDYGRGCKQYSYHPRAADAQAQVESRSRPVQAPRTEA